MKVIQELSKSDLQVIERIEETHQEYLMHPNLLRFPPATSEQDTQIALELQEQMPIKIFRYGADGDPEIGRTVGSLFEAERDRRLAEGMNVSRGQIILQESLQEGFGAKTYTPKAEAKKFRKIVTLNKPDIFLVEGFGQDLWKHLEFFHDLIVWYDDMCPSMFVLTEEGYKPFFGFQGYAGSGWVDIYTEELPLPNGVTPRSECYRVSRLGITKKS